MTKAPRIDAARLERSIACLAEVGAYRDEAAGLVGVNRLALTSADGEGRARVRRWFEEAGLEIRVDRIGNCIARRRGTDARAAAVMSGSHIDSVPTGGAFDGALGVLGALEVVRALNDAGVTTRRPIDLAFFTDEEGARFGTDMLGSAVAVGRIPLEAALGLEDERGLSVGGELEKIGFLGASDPRLEPPFAYLELHIEQGPILAARGVELGVVTGVQGISWKEVKITGKSAHAGTTPMELRRDPALAAAKIAIFVDSAVRSGRFGADARATVGRIDSVPNRVNIVPSRVTCTVDLRNPSDDAMGELERALEAYFEVLEAELGVTIEARQTARTPRVEFSRPIQRLLASRMEARKKTYLPILSGAGHDAQELASLCPAGMIFVRGEYDGISHNPREYSTPEACASGAEILLDAILELADSPGWEDVVARHPG